MALSDLFWDDNKRDLVFTKDGNIAVNSNCSTQNGGILLEARAMNIAQPAFGVGFNTQIMNGPTSYAVLQLNRWVQQVSTDGGKANWQPVGKPSATIKFTASVNYGV